MHSSPIKAVLVIHSPNHKNPDFIVLWLLPITDWMHLFGNRYSVDVRAVDGRKYVPTQCEPFSDRIFMVCECDSCKSGECLHGEHERFSTAKAGKDTPL